MESKIQPPETLVEAIQYFGHEDNAFRFMVGLRWPNGVHCPRCGSAKVGFIATRKMWECKECETKRQFTVKLGTIFEDSALPLSKWLAAIWMIANAKNGISSYEVHRSIGVTQKTAWFMLQRIRLAMQNGSFETMDGEIEADETYVGGKGKFKHRDKLRPKGRSALTKVPVAGLLERGAEGKASRVKVLAVRGVRRNVLLPHILKNVKQGAKIFTDAFYSYRGLHHAYTHEFIDHAITYANGKVHTNGMENFWSLLKRALKGTYVSVDPVHLFRDLDEQAFRFNERKDCDAGRFTKVLEGIAGKRLTYAALTDGKGGEDLLPA